MVAYSFKKRFAPLIANGSKRQTVRAGRRRHAAAGERVQLYVGMRTKHCVKIIPDPVVVAVAPMRIYVGRRTVTSISVNGQLLNAIEREAFAMSDGFESIADMHAFWTSEHSGIGWFDGILIRW